MPKKRGGGEPLFEDVVLPGFDQPESEPERVKSKKEEDDDKHKISYRRYRPAKRCHCDVCVKAHTDGEQPGINQASYIRHHRGEQLYLCFRHKNEAEHRDQLAANGKS